MHLKNTKCREVNIYARKIIFRLMLSLLANRNLLMKISLLSICLTISSMLAAHSLSGQALSRVTATLEAKNSSFRDALKQLEKQSSIRFTYKSSDVVPFSNITLSATSKPMQQVLESLLKGTGLTYEQVENTVILKKGMASDEEATHPDKQRHLFQQVTTTGKVVNETGQPVAGVTVREKGLQNFTNTNADGTYSLELKSSDATVVFSFIGYQTRELTYNELAGKQFQIVLEPDYGKLDEVTIIAYGTSSRRVSTGTTASISSKDIANAPINDPLSALQGRVAGLEINSTNGLPGSAFTVRLRGLNSINPNGESKNDPLYIIDGIPYFSQPLNQFTGDNGQQSPLSGINPADIERIDVLKDADATAIYGSRGANGVILITTKKGKGGKTQVNFNVYSGAGKVTNQVDMLNTAQYLDLRKEAYKNSGTTPDPETADLYVWDQKAYTNWQDKLIGHSAKLTEANFSVSGGSDLTTFLLSGTFRNEGTVQGNDYGYKKGSGMLTVAHSTPDQKFSVSATANYTGDLNHGLATDLTQYYNLPPNMPIYNEDGSYYWYANSQNPMALFLRNQQSHNKTLLASSVIKYTPIKGLDLSASIGYNNTHFDQVRTLPLASFNPQTAASSEGDYGNSQNSSYSIEPQAKYNLKLGHKGNLDLLLGGTWQQEILVGQWLIGTDYSTDAQLENIGAATNVRTERTNYSKYRYQAIFARATYNWDSKYIVNASFRRDGSSRFGPNKRFGNFAAVGAAWVFSEENGIKNALSFLSFGKLRGSYGTTGNDQIGDYQYLDSWSLVNYPYDGITGFSPSRLANPDYSWERNRKLEGGLELGFLENRLNVNINYYFNRSDNQLINYTLSPQTGFNGYTANLPALVHNKGWEFEISSTNIHSNYFEWNTSANLTISRNKLIKYPGLEGSGLEDKYAIGKPLDIEFGYKFTGVDPQTGVAQFADLSGDGEVNAEWADQYVMGSRMPNFYGGLTNTFRYKKLEVNFLLQFVKQRGDALNAGYSAANSLGIVSNFDTWALDRWKQPNDVTDVPRAAQSSTDEAYIVYNDLYRHSDALWVDASYIRLKNLTISYDLTDVLHVLKTQRLSLYVQGQNLFTITKYKGFDPETQGTVVPPIKYYNAGIRFTY
ncbi:TonB-linked outer membrane protein, SusC/RagA family [bacterium A37T11]|nr:TonB-linked outer membrane protein, SusC/RagA family [bacterium A37T11]